MAIKVGIPKGTRDFSAEELGKRNYIFDIVKKAFVNYGFQPIETPTFENNETLMGKYGEEGDRLIFKILNSGDYFDKIDEDLIKKDQAKVLSTKITEKALRYDLTVPFARYVVQHQADLVFPFKRYQIQPVWRADRPQKGRFREFYQCDADVVGSNSLLQEVELVQLYDEVFTKLGLKNTSIKINNRKILSGIAEMIGAKDKLVDFTVALDKLDKIGEDKVKEEMLDKGISADSIKKVQPLFNFTGDNSNKIKQLTDLLSSSSEGMKGVEELKYIIETVDQLQLSTSKLQIDVTLARGLNYYTGSIFEVSANGVDMGSIGGGGRYDDLTGIFGLKNMSGVGISFGLDRIYLVLESLQLFPDTLSFAPHVLIINEEKTCLLALDLLKKLRNRNVSAELFPDAAKFDKQFKYAERKGISIVVKSILDNSTLVYKNLLTGEQKEIEFETFFHDLK
jgi:histidyl-tRNA synthetase